MHSDSVEICRAVILRRRQGCDKVSLIASTLMDPIDEGCSLQLNFDAPKGAGEGFVRRTWPGIEVRLIDEPPRTFDFSKRTN